MTVLELGYGMSPRGHSSIIRIPASEKENQLMEIFSRWMETNPETKHFTGYWDAKKLIPEGQISPPEAHAWLSDPRLSSIDIQHKMGPFLSAVYAKSGAPVVVYDIPMKIYALGTNYRGILVNTAEVDAYFGSEATCVINLGSADWRLGYKAGFVVNAGTAESCIGEESGGVVVNLGVAGTKFATGAKGIVVPFREPEGYGEFDRTGKLVDRDDAPLLKEYVLSLVDCVRKDGDILGEFGTADKIMREVKTLLGQK
jgi:hypothetical protein